MKTILCLLVVLAAQLTWIHFADLGTVALEDTYGNQLANDTLQVTESPTFQNGVNVVQVTAPSRYLIEGEL